MAESKEHQAHVQRLFTLRGDRFVEQLNQVLTGKKLTYDNIQAGLAEVTRASHGRGAEILNANLMPLSRTLQSIRDNRLKTAAPPSFTGTVTVEGPPIVLAGLLADPIAVDINRKQGIPPCTLAFKSSGTDIPLKMVFKGKNGNLIQLKDVEFLNPMDEKIPTKQVTYSDPSTLLVCTNLQEPLFEAGDVIADVFVSYVENPGPFRTKQYRVDPKSGKGQLVLEFPKSWLTAAQAKQELTAKLARMSRTAVSFAELHLRGQAEVIGDRVTYQFVQQKFDRRCLQLCVAAVRKHGRKVVETVTLDDDRFIEARLCCVGVTDVGQLAFSSWLQTFFKGVKIK